MNRSYYPSTRSNYSRSSMSSDNAYVLLPTDEDMLPAIPPKQPSRLCEAILKCLECCCPSSVLRVLCYSKEKCKNAAVVVFAFFANIFGIADDLVIRIRTSHQRQQLYEMDELKQQIVNLTDDLSKSQIKSDDASNKIHDLRTQIENLNKELEYCESSSKAEIKRLESNLKTAIAEKETALTRLSAIAGSKLRHNNPGIVDLSDENRPNKLAEKYNELYDNEWTEAYEAMENSNEYGRDEETIIARLLESLKDIYDKCTLRAANQRQELCNAALVKKTDRDNPSKWTHVVKKISDLQKQISIDIIGSLTEELQADDTFRNKFQFEIDNCSTYLQTCVRLCWLMSVQDPPVVLKFDFHYGDAMDTNIVRAYTKTGNSIKYLVWPPMLLYEGGPLLQKGVTQPQ